MKICAHCTLDGPIGQFMQFIIPAQSGNKTSIILCFAPLHQISRSKVTVASDNDHRIGSLFSDTANDLIQQGSNIVLYTLSARFQNGGDQIALQAFVNVKGHVAMTMIVGIEQTQFLLTISIIIGIITIEDDQWWFIQVGFNKAIKYFLSYAILIFIANGVFQTAHGRLGGKFRSTLRQSACTHFEEHIIMKIIAIVTIPVTRCYLKYTLERHLFYGMVSVSLIPTICNTAAYTINEA